jgi:DNA-binding transcriptional MerR regulator
MRTYSIRELGEEFGVTARTLRFYEGKGLISPKRQGVTRIFSERDKVRLELTLRGKRLGFSLEEIRQIIDMYDPEQPHDPAQIIYLCQKIRDHRRELINKIKDINDTLYLMDEVENDAMKALGAQYDTRD